MNRKRKQPIVVCLDKFRGSASAADACHWLAEGVRAAETGHEVLERPIADGGEGTVEALASAGYRRVGTRATGPLGSPIDAHIAVRGDLAVVELTQASGLDLLPKQDRAPLLASTYGTGELLRAALDLGCREIVLAVGTSASTDGGAGLLQALGARLLDADGNELSPGGGALTGVAAIDLSGLDRRLHRTRVTLACDVDNPLLGPQGTAAVCGPKKNADAGEIRILEAGLERFSRLVAGAVGKDYSDHPGAGAAGGAGFAALAVLRASRRSGAQFVMDELGLQRDLPGARLLIVGEGCLDAQSLRGKAPIGAAGLAAAAGVPVYAVAGQVKVTTTELAERGISRAFALLPLAGNVKVAMADTARLLRRVGKGIAGQIDVLAEPAPDAA